MKYEHRLEVFHNFTQDNFTKIIIVVKLQIFNSAARLIPINLRKREVANIAAPCEGRIFGG